MTDHILEENTCCICTHVKLTMKISPDSKFVEKVASLTGPHGFVKYLAIWVCHECIDGLPQEFNKAIVRTKAHHMLKLETITTEIQNTLDRLNKESGVNG